MVLLTVSEVRAESEMRGISVLTYTDDMITAKLASYQADIEVKTNRIFDTTIVTNESHQNNTKCSFTVDNTPLLSIQQIKIDDTVYDLFELKHVDSETGTICFNKEKFNMGTPYDILIDYTVGEYNSNDILAFAKEILMDLFFIKVGKARKGTGVTTDNKDPMIDIDDRCLRISKPKLTIF